MSICREPNGPWRQYKSIEYSLRMIFDYYSKHVTYRHFLLEQKRKTEKKRFVRIGFGLVGCFVCFVSTMTRIYLIRKSWYLLYWILTTENLLLIAALTTQHIFVMFTRNNVGIIEFSLVYPFAMPWVRAIDALVQAKIAACYWFIDALLFHMYMNDITHTQLQNQLKLQYEHDVCNGMLLSFELSMKFESSSISLASSHIFTITIQFGNK